MLIAFGGLPGTGKSTVAQALARRLAAVYVRIDTLEHALLASEILGLDAGPAGYIAAYAVAADNLRLGATVVVDCVNALQVTRTAWRNVASGAGVQICEVELICSDPKTHQQRVEGRRIDIAGFKPPTWDSVLERQYEPWESQHLVVDTANVSVKRVVEAILIHLSTLRK